MSIKLNVLIEALYACKEAFMLSEHRKDSIDDVMRKYVYNPLKQDLESFVIEGTIKTDSKNIYIGDIFACIKGLNVDGHSFAENVTKHGASLLIVEAIQDLPIMQILVKDSRKATAIIARVLHDNPSEKFDLIGVTGTNGKTTTTVILEQLFQELGYKTGMIGTLGYKIGTEYFPSERTTPDIIELNEILSQMAKAECQIVIMEVSSHSLALDRVYGLKFKIGIFTNLSQDHLDFHKNMDDYGNAKNKLFKMVETSGGTSIINIDDNFGKEIFNRLTSRKVAYTMNERSISNPESTKNNSPTKLEKDDIWTISEIVLKPEYTIFSIINNENIFKQIKSSLIGKFNIYNLVAALIAVSEIAPKENFPLKNNKDSASKCLQNMKSATGRIEKIKNDINIDIYVDYAHTPEALNNIIDTVRDFTKKRVICVWGCGGNRDKEKRPQMGRISIQKADITIITNDNPRLEFASDIIRDIIREFSYTDPYIIIRERSEAIKVAILLAQKGDAVIIAGKGHENYQEIGTVKYHFDDREEALKGIVNKKQVTELRIKSAVIRKKLSKAKIEEEKAKKLDYKEENQRSQLMVPIDLLNLEKILNITLRNDLLQDNKPLFTSVSTDSRNVWSNTLFFALKGDKYDGADFVKEVLLKSESNWAITRLNNCKTNELNDIKSESKEICKIENRIIYTQDPLLLYGMLAQKYLKLFGAKTIALTGSTGKTTTKEILYNVLSAKNKTFKSFENENNQIGVPKNVFNMRPEYEYAIFEIGTSRLGEIEYLSKILLPDCGGVISINASHLEYLESLEKIGKEKLSLLDYVKDFGVIPADFKSSIETLKTNKIYTFGDSKSADFRIVKSEMNEEGLVVAIEDRFLEDGKMLTSPPTPLTKVGQIKSWQTSIQMPYLAENIAFAVSIATILGIDEASIENGLKKELFVENRMEILKTDTQTILFDCYNANPCSMKAAIEFWLKTEPNKTHIAILGDMLELGENSIKYHQEIGKLLRKDKKMLSIGIGELAKHYKTDHHFENVDLFVENSLFNDEILSSDSIILVKGSNGINLLNLKKFFTTDDKPLISK
ncbi:MAG: UDP-N-acetylmuramoyl-L-alanyl-D-glutamate--2,6-diaminopimelate ligase [Candidatus Cloacimonetes bacterium]|nr:UDP-N-acetylmuramoyl-L-alanyl-D-glutamate--2,6-diaminopimelate ligase [Candidatus Cloacimonadota bacterium]